jgi:hypothetical protein
MPTVSPVVLTKNELNEFSITRTGADPLKIQGFYPNLREEVTSSNSNITEIKAAAKTVGDDGATLFYTVAVKTTNVWSKGTSYEGSNTSWEIYFVKPDGSLDYDPGKTARNIQAIGIYESYFGVDLNADSTTGVKIVSTEDTSSSVKLLVDSDRCVWIQDGNERILVKQWNGDPANNIETYNKQGENENFQKAVAVEKLVDQDGHAYYLIASKSFNRMTSGSVVTESTNGWSVYKVTDDGKVQEQKYSKGITGRELDFGQDLNGDGAQDGTPVVTLVAVDQNTSPDIRVGRDSDGVIYVKEGGIYSAVVNENGDSILNEGSGSSPMSGSTKTEVMGVAKQTDGSYIFAISNTQTNAGVTKVDWSVQSLTKNSSGKWNWGTNLQTKSIGDFEGTDFFNQDLNNDGVKGVNLDNIKIAPNEKSTTPARLFKDSTTGALYIKDGTGGTEKLIAIKDRMGGSPNLENSYSYPGMSSGGGATSYKSEAYAVERVVEQVSASSNTTTAPMTGGGGSTYYPPSGSAGSASPGAASGASAGSGSSSGSGATTTQVVYKLALKNTNTNNGKDEITWQIHTIAEDGTFDWSGSKSVKSIAELEQDVFKQDMNGDKVIGIDKASFKSISKSTVTQVELKKDTDGALYLFDGTNTFTIKDSWGNTPTLEYSNTWGGGSAGGTSGSNESKVVAAEKITTDGVVTYKLAIKMTNTYDGKTEVNWQIQTLDAKGVMDWSKSTWTKSIGSSESIFNQDLNGDGFTGFDPSKLTAVAADTVGVGLARDGEGTLYIREEGKTPVQIADTRGGAMSIEYSNTYSSGSNKAEAMGVEKVTGGYKLAIKMTNVMGNNTDVNWQIYTLNEKGQQDWSIPNATTWTKNIVNFERVFNQDLDGDGNIGLKIENLVKLTTDTSGIGVARDANKNIYLQDGTAAPLAVTDSSGNSPMLENSSSWDGGSYKSEVFAATKDGDGYRLAVKSTNTQGENKTYNWQVYSLNSMGVVDWSKYSYTKSITKEEKLFNQDLNEDGSIGPQASTMLAIGNDTLDATLIKDADGGIWIKEGAELTAVTDSMGNTPNMDFSNAWTGGSNATQAYAVQRVSAGGEFKLAVKNVNEYNGTQDINWQIYTLSNSGVIDWSKTSWTKSVANSEKYFQQDLNGDGVMGSKKTGLVALTTDTTGVQVVRDPADPEKNLYIQVNAGNFVTITDANGGVPNLESSSQWSGGSYESKVIAAEAQTDGSFKLVVQNKSVYNQTTDLSWQIYTVSSEGVLDWGRTAWTKSLNRVERVTREDLDKDGQAGVSATTTDIATDTTGATLAKDSDGVLYIKESGSYKEIVDANGSTPSFEYANSWTGGSSKSEAFAVQVQTDGSYRLAIKNTNTYGTKTEVTWQIHTLSTDGVIDWSKSSWTRSIGSFESQFGQDLNGDGTTGLKIAALTRFDTDKSTVDGETDLYKDAGGALYIKEGTTYIAILDANGGAPNLDYVSTWTGGELKSLPFAVEKQSDGTYRLAVKVSTLKEGQDTPEVSWQIHTLSAKNTQNQALLDWSKASTVKNVSVTEKLFKQDLNGDGSTGIDADYLSTLEAIATDTSGARLLHTTEGELFLQVDAQTTLAIVDKTGNAPALESSFTWTDGGIVTQAYAVNKFEDSTIDTYKLLIKETTTIGTDQTVSWKVYNIAVDSSSAVIDLNFTEAPTALNFETALDQDLTGDGSKVSASNMSYWDTPTDTAGEALARESVNSGGFYIKGGTLATPLLIKDVDGSLMNFDANSTFLGGTSASKGYAVEVDSDGTFKLLVKVDTVTDEQTETSWNVYGIDDEGVVDWSQFSAQTDVSYLETLFKQDLNGNRTIDNPIPV